MQFVPKPRILSFDLPILDFQDLYNLQSLLKHLAKLALSFRLHPLIDLNLVHFVHLLLQFFKLFFAVRAVTPLAFVLSLQLFELLEDEGVLLTQQRRLFLAFFLLICELFMQFLVGFEFGLEFFVAGQPGFVLADPLLCQFQSNLKIISCNFLLSLLQLHLIFQVAISLFQLIILPGHLPKLLIKFDSFFLLLAATNGAPIQRSLCISFIVLNFLARPHRNVRNLLLKLILPYFKLLEHGLIMLMGLPMHLFLFLDLRFQDCYGPLCCGDLFGKQGFFLFVLTERGKELGLEALEFGLVFELGSLTV